MKQKIGVLALQGAFQKHLDMLQTLGVNCCSIRHSNELDDCTALIIPGGESTTISLLMQKNGLDLAIKNFAKTKGVMGVCAGMIMLANQVDDKRVAPLGIIPFNAQRNHYGRQVHSFSHPIKLKFDPNNHFSAIFIRAPSMILPEPINNNSVQQIEILAHYKNEPIMVRYKKHLALSFHPELTDDNRIHQFWLNLQE